MTKVIKNLKENKNKIKKGRKQMKKVITILAVPILSMFLMVGNVLALEIGTNITINDKKNQDSDWHQYNEDQEVEPGMEHGQQWDLEGFFQNNNQLSMVAGFDFENGVPGYSKYASGDIFIDVNNDADYGRDLKSDSYNQTVVQDTFGYDYVLDLDFDNSTYNVYALDSDTSTVAVWYNQNSGSNPWRYNDKGKYLSSGSFEYWEGLDDNDSVIDLNNEFEGGNHYALTGFDLSFLGDTEFITHFTMGCGNDNLMGKGTAPVPESTTILLFGCGLIGLATLRKKFKK